MYKVLVVGIGSVGQHILEFLARMPGAPHIVAADKQEEWVLKKRHNAVMGAQIQGFAPRIDAIRLDLDDIESTAQVLAKLQPDVIINTTTLQAWHKLLALPPDVWPRLSAANLGPWLPLQLTLPHKLMRAVRESGKNLPVVNVSFPDAVNPALAKIGLAPTIGAGNIDLVTAGIREIVASRLSVNIYDVKVLMVGHHSHFAHPREPGYRKPPYLLTILVDGRDVTGQFDLDELVLEGPRMYPIGMDLNLGTASSAIKNALSIATDAQAFTHAPGPLGLPGGYPVRIGASNIQLALPDGVSPEDAVRVNQEAQKCDGISEIRDDGTVVFEPASAAIMKEMLGYDCKELRIEESEDRATELLRKYEEFALRFRR